MAVAGTPQFYMDDKWKLSKKEGSRSTRGSSSTTNNNATTSGSSSDSHFMRSRSCAAGASDSSSSSSHFMRSRSCAASDSHFLRNPSHRGSRSSFSRKCATLVKEQRAKFYIMRRCVTMLICWRDRSSGSK